MRDGLAIINQGERGGGGYLGRSEAERVSDREEWELPMETGWTGGGAGNGVDVWRKYAYMWLGLAVFECSRGVVVSTFVL